MAGEKPGAPVNVLWGLFKFVFLYFFFFFHESVKVYNAVHKVVYTELHLVMTATDREESEMLTLHDALIGDIASQFHNTFSFILKYD